jgi:hypothetical protein
MSPRKWSTAPRVQGRVRSRGVEATGIEPAQDFNRLLAAKIDWETQGYGQSKVRLAPPTLRTMSEQDSGYSRALDEARRVLYANLSPEEGWERIDSAIRGAADDEHWAAIEKTAREQGSAAYSDGCTSAMRTTESNPGRRAVPLPARCCSTRTPSAWSQLCMSRGRSPTPARSQSACSAAGPPRKGDLLRRVDTNTHKS